MKYEQILGAEAVNELKEEFRKQYVLLHGEEPTEKWLTNSVLAVARVMGQYK